MIWVQVQYSCFLNLWELGNYSFFDYFLVFGGDLKSEKVCMFFIIYLYFVIFRFNFKFLGLLKEKKSLFRNEVVRGGEYIFYEVS